MGDALLLWLLVVAVGIVALPFTELLFASIPTGGFVFARPLGLLLVAFPVWLLASLHVVPYRRGVAAASLVVVAAVAAVLWRRGLGRPAGGARSIWLGGEAVFTAAYFVWALLRSFAPEVWQTEKPMDMALVNAVNKSDWFPPHDPWQAGTNVNYYYYGHYLVSFLLRLTGIDPAIGYNLAVALVYALMASAVFGVAAVVYQAARNLGDAPARSPLVAGLAAVAAAAAVGNIAGGIQYLHAPERFATYDWWSPSRVIPGTANEFPFFSFLLGDLHAHTLVTPFALVSLAYAVQLALHGPPLLVDVFRRPAVAAELLLAALVLGSTYATNSFDFPTAVALGLGALVLWALEAPGRWRRVLGWGAGWLAAGILLYVPFWRSFSPPASSVGLVHDHTLFSSFARDYAYIYGLSLWVILALFAGRVRLPVRYLLWSGALLLFVLVLLAPPRLAGLTVALLLAGSAVYFTFATGAPSQPARVVWLLTAVGLSLLATGEVVYLRDAFDHTASFRFNTVFKMGYQAWFLLAIVAGVGVLWSERWLGRRVRLVWLVGLCALVGLGLVYPVAGWYSRSNRFSNRPTLDGMAWLRTSAPHDAAAIDWLRSSVGGASTLLETVGPDFDPAGRARVSTFTGLPAVMGWAGHELQWGHDPGTRATDVQEIYRSSDLEEAARLLRRYNVRYVFVGSLERRDYPRGRLQKFARLGNPVFRSGSTVVYELPAERIEAAADGRIR